jgi:hypothetical protein
MNRPEVTHAPIQPSFCNEPRDHQASYRSKPNSRLKAHTDHPSHNPDNRTRSKETAIKPLRTESGNHATEGRTTKQSYLENVR